MITTVTRLYIFICLAYCLECHSASESNVFLFQIDFVELAQSFSKKKILTKAPPPPESAIIIIMHRVQYDITEKLVNYQFGTGADILILIISILRRLGPCGINVDGKTGIKCEFDK